MERILIAMYDIATLVVFNSGYGNFPNYYYITLLLYSSVTIFTIWFAVTTLELYFIKYILFALIKNAQFTILLLYFNSVFFINVVLCAYTFFLNYYYYYFKYRNVIFRNVYVCAILVVEVIVK